MSAEIRPILLFQSQPHHTAALQNALKQAGISRYEFVAVEPDALKSRLEPDRFQLAMLVERAPSDRVLSRLQMLKRRCPDLPVIIISSTNQPARVAKFLAAGAQCCLTDAETQTEVLVRAVGQALKRQPAPGPAASNGDGRLQNALNSAPLVLLALDAAGTITAFEGQGVFARGRQPGELVGRSVWDAATGYPELLPYLKQALDGAAFSVDVSFPEGNVYHIQFSPLRGADGTLHGCVAAALDMTPQARAAQLLQESHIQLEAEAARQAEDLRIHEERLETGLKATHVGLWEWDIQTNRSYYSPTWYTMLGYTPGELPMEARTWYDLMHPQDADGASRAVQQVWDGKVEEYEAEFRMRARSGEWHWILSRGRVLERDASGAPKRMIGTHTDISERKRTEMQLRSLTEELQTVNEDLRSINEEYQATNEELLDANTRLAEEIALRRKANLILLDQTALLDLANDAIIVRDLDDRCVFWNRGAERLYGYSKTEALGEVVHKLLQTRFSVPLAEIKEQAQRTGTYRSEQPQVAKDGRPLVIESVWAPKYDDHGELAGYLQVNRDITERKQAEALLRRYELLSTSSRDIILFVDRASGRILEANAAAARAYGFSRDELLEKTIQDLRAPDTLALTAEQMAAADNGGLRFETRHRRRDGGEFPVEVSSQGATIGETRVLVSIIRDITERKQAEAALRANEENLRRATGLAQLGVFDWLVPEDRPRWHNDRMYEIFGRAPEDGPIGGAEFYAGVLHPDDKPGFERDMQAALSSNRMFHTVCRIRRSQDGEWRWIEYLGDFELGPDGAPLRLTGVIADVTERQEAQREKDKLLRMIEVSGDFIASADLDGRLTYVNPAGRRMIGIAEDEDVGKLNFVDYVPDEWRDYFRDTIIRTAREAGYWEGEMQLQHRQTGQRIDVHRTTFLIRDPETGSPVGYSTVTRDITALKRAQEAVESVALFPEENPSPVLRFSADGQILYLNATAKSMFADEGWAPEGPAPDALWLPARAALQCDERCEFDMSARNGRVFLISCMPLPKKGYVNLYGRDITAIRTAERALRQSRADLQRAQAVAHVGSWRFALSSANLEWSEETYRIFEVAAGTPMTYEVFLGFIHPDDRASVNAAWQAALAGAPYDIEHRIVAGERVKWVREQAELERDAEGNLLGGFGTVQDITERRQAEEQLKASETRYRELFSSMSEMFQVLELVYDEHGHAVDFYYREVNPATERLTGKRREEMVGRRAKDLFGVVEDYWLQALDQVNRSGAPLHVENYSQAVDKYWDVNAFKVAERANAVAIVFSDVTERKRAEAALRESQELLRRRAEELQTLMNVAPVALWVAHDPDCSDIAGNAMANRFYEAHEGENVSASVNSTRRFFRDGVELQPEDLPMQWAAAHNADVQNDLLDVLLPSGNWLAMHGSASPLRDAEGRVRGAIAAFVDVTERRKAEAALKESEARFRSMANSLPLIVWVHDADGQQEFVNDTFCDYFGVTREEMGGGTWRLLLHPDDADEYSGAFLACVRERRFFHAETRVRNATGEWRWVESWARPRFGDGGEFLGFIGVSADITERRAAEAAVRASDRRLRIALDSYPYGFAIYDAERRYEYVNDWSLKAAGLPPDRLLWHRDEEVFPPEITQAYVPHLETAYRTGKNVVFEWEMPEAVGGRTVMAAYVPVADDDGVVHQVLAILQDITERKLAEKALRESEERFRAVFEEASIGMAMLDLQGGLMAMNPALQRMMGYSESELRALDAPGITHPDDWAVDRELFESVVRGERGHYSIEKRYVHSNGSILYGQLTMFGICDADGRLQHAVAMVEDITARKAAEDALRQAKEEYRILVENQTDLIVNVTPDGRFLYASPSYTALFQPTPGESAFDLWSRRVHPEDRDALFHVFSGTLRPPYTGRIDVRGFTEQGWRWLSWAATSVLDELTGEPVSVVAVGRDITDLKRLEAELRDSEMRYRRLVQAAPAPIAVFVRGRIAYINSAGVALVNGQDPEQWIGRRATQFIHPEDRDRLRALFRHVEETRLESEVCEFRLIRAENELRYVEMVATHSDFLGENAVQAVIRDITEQKQAEAALMESEDRFRKLAEASFEGILFHEDNAILEVNGSLLRMFGYAPGELAGKSVTDLVAPEHVEYMQRMLRTGLSDTFEARGRRKDGSYIPLEVLDRAMTWERRPVRVLALRDITQRKEMESALRDSEQRYRRLVEESPDAIFVVADGKVAFVNRAALDLFDAFQDEEVLGLSFMSLVHPASRADVAAGMDGLPQRVSGFPTLQYKLVRRDGVEVDIEGRPIPFTFQGRDAVLHVAHDITERKRIEEQIRRHGEELERLVAERTTQIQKLEQQKREFEKTVAIGRMAARIAHEINNPLAGVKNSFVLIKRAIPADHQHYEFVGRIDREIDRIARIVRQMFELYRPEHKEPGQFRPADVIRDVAAMLEGNLRAQGVDVEFDTAAAARPIRLHEDSLRQVLFSIVQNAIEASHAGGVIRITAAVTDGCLDLAVADNGCGIPEDARARIFEPFFTTKSGLTTGGLGLGLSITKGLIEALGGSLTFETEVGRGTTFYIHLPVQIEQKEVNHA